MELYCGGRAVEQEEKRVVCGSNVCPTIHHPHNNSSCYCFVLSRCISLYPVDIRGAIKNLRQSRRRKMANIRKCSSLPLLLQRPPAIQSPPQSSSWLAPFLVFSISVSLPWRILSSRHLVELPLPASNCHLVLRILSPSDEILKFD